MGSWAVQGSPPMPQAQQMSVTIPVGVAPGQPFSIAMPDGTQMQVVAPVNATPGMAIMVSAPVQTVAMAAPVLQPVGFGQQMAQTGMAPGNSFLLSHNGLYVRMALNVAEVVTGCEMKNQYSFTPIPAGTPIPATPDSSWSRSYREAASFNPLLKGKEESECMERICCPLFRGFKMDLKDGNGSTFLSIERPFKFDFCYAPPLCTCNTQEMNVSLDGVLIARAAEATGPCCTTGCTARTFDTFDASGKLVYKLKIDECCSQGGGSNFAAPTCCNESFTVDVYDANGVLLKPSTFVFPGCNCGGLHDMTNMVIAFPEGATADERTALLAGMMLIEFTVMERRRQENKDNGGGGAPANKEMER